MEYQRFGRDLLVRLDKGEELHDAIRSLSNHGISTAAITSGIGRVRGTEIGFLDSNGIYQKMKIEEPMELLSMQGNLAPGPDGAFAHIHIVASDDDHVVRGRSPLRGDRRGYGRDSHEGIGRGRCNHGKKSDRERLLRTLIL